MSKKSKWELFFIGIVIIFSILFIAFIILMPFILDKYLYSTHFYDSHLSSSEWSSFNGSYIGAILGGLLGGIFTLIGIKITISFTRKQVNEDRRLSIVPYMLYNLYEEEEPYIKENYDMRLHCIIDDNYIGNINCIMRFKNIGVGPLLDLEICNVFFNEERMDYIKSIITNPSCDIVEKDSECFMLIALSLRLDKKEKESSKRSPLDNEIQKQGTLSFKVRYKDLMGYKYEQGIKIFMMTSFTFDEDKNVWQGSDLPAFTVKDMEIGKCSIVYKK